MRVSFYETSCRVRRGEAASVTVSMTAGSLIATVVEFQPATNNLS
jgi:hypothetical protein